MHLIELYNALAPCIGPVLAEKYPQIGMAAGELVVIAAALSRLIGWAKGSDKAASLGTKALNLLNIVGMFKKS